MIEGRREEGGVQTSQGVWVGWMGNSHRTESEVRFDQVRGSKLRVCKGVTVRGTHGESVTVGRENEDWGDSERVSG